MRRLIVGFVVAGCTLGFATSAMGQSLVVMSQRFTFQLPGQAIEVVQPLMPAVIDRNGSLTQTLNGGFGGAGTVLTSGTARGTASWSASSVSWSAQATIQNSILDTFEQDDYDSIGLRAQVITEVRFQVLEVMQVQMTRIGANGTSSGSDFFSDFGRPFVLPLDALGEPIPGQGFEVGLNDPARELLPGMYVARVRSAAIVVTSLGNPPVSGSATIVDGATLVVVPAPGTAGLVMGLGLLAGRRRRCNCGRRQ